ncbi:type I-C CRISPR-associated endonuclease Cas1c [Rhodopirellula sp. MGV]|uniref:type I-C CRISPR-associated endonuclease Cas1c n=1 Tax=Rhodopirellula sp. MGV TaxID=2023130 RepID=UPI000B9657DE|nr:type I-C CRISPR-associated endonuclease Cas1c [Rhodopirellula sp. MGV]OYP35556.1 subtype I-C CRISPR-associated endonuclease Cas1 [Rhodopirellula sp. MGV]PNY34593.1 type I-C CRISPR-associated endonuclease Cas1 [Rhodopirellula baltica]
MKRHLNTLFVTTEGSYLAKEGASVLVRQQKQTLLRVPLHNLDGIVCFGRVGFSSQLAAACAANDVTLSLMSTYGKFHASVVGYSPGNVLLRRQQYRVAADVNRSALIARNMVAAKIANSRQVYLRAARDCNDDCRRERLQVAAKKLLPAIAMVRCSEDLDQIRGYEGESAARYFAAFNELQNDPESEFRISGRSRRPPLDPMNALLSFLYSILTHDAKSACEAAGLDSAVGFLHRDRPGRPGMALDLMEEFRSFLCDRLALSLVNRKQVKSAGFVKSESGAYRMSDATRKAVLVAYQTRKQDTIEHPFLGEKTTVGLLVHLQARLLARHLRGDLDEYPAFIWR